MYSCFDCGHLDKSRKKYSDKNEDYFMYGCNHRGPDKFVCGWCNSDKDLKRSYMGCSDWKEIEKVVDNENQLQGQMSIEDFIGGNK